MTKLQVTFSDVNYTTNLVDFGGVGDGVTDNSKAILDAAAVGDPAGVFVPAGIYNSALEANAVPGKFIGPGQIVVTRSAAPLNIKHIAAPLRVVVNTPIAGTIANGDPNTWRSPKAVYPFPADPNILAGNFAPLDISSILFPIDYAIVDTSPGHTLGQPATGYQWVPEASVFNITYTSDSGWNQSLNSDDGRTGTAVFKSYLNHKGNGDLVYLNAEITVSGTKPGATHFLANGAGVFLDSDIVAGADGVYLNAAEIHFSDNGFDVAAIGDVRNFNRTNAKGALGTTWIGSRIQSRGSAPIDAAHSVSGMCKVVLDTTTAELGQSQAAIVLAAGQRIYLDGTNTDPDGFPCGTVPGDIWLEFDAPTGKVVVGNGAVRLFSVDRTGNAVFAGTVTQNGAP